MNFWLDESDRQTALKQIRAIEAACVPNMEQSARSELMDRWYSVLTGDSTESEKKSRQEAQEEVWRKNREKLRAMVGQLPAKKKEE